VTKYHTFNKNEFLKQISYLKQSQQSWNKSISEWLLRPHRLPQNQF
jgi:hypothetical protein